MTLFAPACTGRPAAAKTDEHGGRIAGARILLTEDNEINQQIAVELLEGAGAQVQVANNGREAVEKVAQATYDLVLMDLQMPVMDGYQATARIRSDPRFDKLPIIAMTAHATVEERQRCLDAGMVDHISKPIDPVTMFATIAQHYRPASRRRSEACVVQPSSPRRDAADVLPDLPGIDTILGQKRVAGNRKLYLKLLRDFHRDYPAAVRAIREAIDGKRDEEALRLAHTLKGRLGKSWGDGPVRRRGGSRDRAQGGRLSRKRQAVCRGLRSACRPSSRRWPALTETAAEAPGHRPVERCESGGLECGSESAGGHARARTTRRRRSRWRR